ncbi:phospholipase A1-Igamma1, chloroplastic [Typha angustifolia]|uniref:phospholipase A1-Igamma1, chloroplastic n=1 Tax=Typha angustifolia TaxID=59011 RepID=UPI003C2BD8C5
MALASTSSLHHLPLPSCKKNTLLTPHASQLNESTTVVHPPLHQHRSSSSVNLPTPLSNLLHLNPNPNPNPKPTTTNDPHNFPNLSTATTPTYSPREDISFLCPQLHGFSDWSPLLDPLNPHLRREILKYGEFSQATYDAFDFNPFSPYCGSCLYGRNKFVDKLGLARHGYGVTKYLYAMSHVELPLWLERSFHGEAWSKDSNWMGYVAVSGDEESRRIGCRDVVVAWRGTVATAEWLEDLQGRLELLGPEHGDAKVEHGFHSIYTSKSEATRYNKLSASEQVMAEIQRLVTHYRQKGEKVSLTITGHSLGGALALLNAYEAASSIPDLPVSVISFGAPRVGNEAFAEKLKEARVKPLRIVVKQDVVPKLPGILFNEGIKKLESLTGTLEWIYTHVGLELGLDVKSSPYLKKNGLDIPGYHSLETYLHLVDGYLSSDKEFRGNAKRDVALVNKATGMLRDELRIPACWSQQANRGMVCNSYGRWEMPKREQEDIPSPLGGSSGGIGQVIFER